MSKPKSPILTLNRLHTENVSLDFEVIIDLQEAVRTSPKEVSLPQFLPIVISYITKVSKSRH